MTAIAEPPLRRRALERMGMTPEQELELLIREQQADDTPFVNRHEGEISLDAPSPNGEGIISDLIGLDDTGHVVCFFRPNGGLVDATQVPHGTLGGYNNHKCKCSRCRGAVAEYRRKRRQSS